VGGERGNVPVESDVCFCGKGLLVFTYVLQRVGGVVTRAEFSFSGDVMCTVTLKGRYFKQYYF
jgi:hypothetical protein